MHISIQLLQAKCILWNDKWIPPLMFFFLNKPINQFVKLHLCVVIPHVSYNDAYTIISLNLKGPKVHIQYIHKLLISQTSNLIFFFPIFGDQCRKQTTQHFEHVWSCLMMQIIGLGTLVMMPVIGNLSDQYGRKAMLTLPLTLSIIPLGKLRAYWVSAWP